MFAFAHEAIAGRVPFIAGTGSNDTRHAIAMSLEAKQCGADALLLVTPYYNKTNQSGLVRHYNAIADAAGLPVIVYNVPSRTGMNILPETYQGDFPGIRLLWVQRRQAVALPRQKKTKLLCGDALFLYAGNDDQIVPMLSVGAVGAISVLANLAPLAVHDMQLVCARQACQKPVPAASVSACDRRFFRCEPHCREGCAGADGDACGPMPYAAGRTGRQQAGKAV